MKNKIKKTTIILITFITIFCSNRVFALQNIKAEGDNFLNKGTSSAPITIDEAWEKLVPIAQVLLAIASVVLVIAYMYLGIQYMITDPQGKANIKQKLIGLVVATVIIYGGVGIFTIIITLFNSIFA